MKKKLLIMTFSTLVMFLFAILVAGTIVYRVLQEIPSTDKLKSFHPALVSQVYSADGVLLADFFKERRKWTTFDKIPQIIKSSFIVAEDSRFYEHQGVDFDSIVRAALTDLRSGKIVQGGSTITQQLTKMLLLSPEKSFSRKIKEMYLAYKLENRLSKDKILEMYLNMVYLGSGSYGIEAAAETYFAKPMTELSISEAAILAGLPKAPGRFSPILNPKAAKRRQKYVLKRLLDENKIDHITYLNEVSAPIIIKRYNNPYRKKAPFVAEEVRKRMIAKFGEEKFLTGGYKIYTNIVYKWQKYAQDSIKNGLHNVDKRMGYRGPITNISKNKWESYLINYQSKLKKELKKKLLNGIVLIIDSSGNKIDNPLKWLGIDKQLIAKEPVVIKDTLLRIGKIYNGLVTKIDNKSETAVVKIGKYKGIIPLVEVEWARKPDPKKFYKWAKVRKISWVFKPGDIIKVKVLDPLNSYNTNEDKYKVWKKLLNTYNKELNKKIIPLTLEQEPETESALISVDPYTGNIKVAVGGYNFNKTQFNHIFQAKRQVGSAFKPIVYLAALRNGYTLSTILKDIPVVYSMENTTADWRPHNYGGNFKGEMLFLDALTHSKNVVTVRIAQDIGLTPIAKTARKTGVISKLNPDLSMALGSSSLFIWELVRTYSTFDNYGYKINLKLINKIIDADNKIIEDNSVIDTPIRFPDKPIGKKVISPQYAYLMNFMLKNVVLHGTGWRAKALMRPATGKTGTTNDHKDAWFVGYIPQLVTGVWVGYDKLISMGVNETGGAAASPIWVNYMQKVIKDFPPYDFPIPKGIKFVNIDSETGLLATELTENPKLLPFISGTEPKKYSNQKTEEQQMDIIDDMGL